MTVSLLSRASLFGNARRLLLLSRQLLFYLDHASQLTHIATKQTVLIPAILVTIKVKVTSASRATL